MLKNGYLQVIVEKPVEGLDKDEVVYVRSNEFGQIGDNALVRVLRDEKDRTGIIIPIGNLKIKNEEKEEKQEK